jgi:hypothetical protein
MSERSELTMVYEFRIGEGHDDVTGVFVVDGRDYADPDAVRADVRAAVLALRERRLISDYERTTVAVDAPRSSLPSWPAWRDRHIVGDEPIGVRPIPEGRTIPAGWDEMDAWLEHSYGWLKDQMAAAAGAVPDARTSDFNDHGPGRVGSASVVLSEEKYRVDTGLLVRLPADASVPDALDLIAAWLRSAGWEVAEPVVKERTTTLAARNDGHEIDAVWQHRMRSISLLASSPTVDATFFAEA